MLDNKFESFTLSSTSAMISGITGIMRNFITSQFPEKYFKHIKIGTGASSVDDVHSKAKQYLEILRKKPALALRPNFNLDSPLGSVLESSSKWFEIEDYKQSWCVYDNERDRQSLTFNYKRYKVNFTVGIRVESELQAYDVQTFLYNRLRFDNMFFLNNQEMMIQIPSSIIKVISQDLGNDFNDPVQLKATVDKMNQYGFSDIDIYTVPSSGLNTISFIQNMNVLVNFSGTPSISVEKIGRSVDFTTVNFEVETEFSYPKSFKAYTETQIDIEFSPDDGSLVAYSNSFSPPIDKDGKVMIDLYKIQTEANVAFDSVDLTDFLPDKVLNFINTKVNEGDLQAVTDAVDFNVMYDNTLLADNEFSFDAATQVLTINTPLFNYIYGVGLYINKQTINDFDAEIRGVSNDLRFSRDEWN